MKREIEIGRYRVEFDTDGDEFATIRDKTEKEVSFRHSYSLFLSIRHAEELEAEAVKKDKINELWAWLEDMTKDCPAYSTSRIQRLRELTGWAK